MPRRSTPVVFNFDLSIDDAPRTPTPFEPIAAQSEPHADAGSWAVQEPEPETEPDAENVREMPTPIMQSAIEEEPVPAVPPPSAEAFATETMAELYVRQGLRHEAIAVYRQLIEARPSERALRDRLAELEDDGHVAAGSTARAFFGALSRRSSKGRSTEAHKLPDGSPPRGSLDRLFGEASVARLDEHAAESLSAAFGTAPAHPEESAVDRVFNPDKPRGR
jgi:hypothetical protein